MKKLLVIFTLLCTSVSALMAQNLMFDFGPTAASGAGLTNSPAHANSSFLIETETTWNTIAGGSQPSGTYAYADGSEATGVSVRLGTETGADTFVLNYLATPPSTNDLGSGSNGSDPGFFGSTLFGSLEGPARDGIWNGINPFANGIRVDGLSAGQYQIWTVGFNTNENNSGQSMNLYAATGASSDTFDFNALTPSTSVITNNSSWVQGENYAVASVNLSLGESLFIANDGLGSNNRGFLNSIQIIAVPEPGTYALIFGLVIGVLALLRRRR